MKDLIDIPGRPELTANDYAEKYNISRRTVSRYIKQGKIDAVRRKGRTFIIDLEPKETPIEPEPADKLNNQDTESGQLAITSESYFRLGELTVKAKAGQRWKMLSCILLVLVFIATPAVVWLYLSWQDTAADLVSSQAATNAITADLDNTTNTIDQLEKEMAQAKTTAAELTATITAGDTIRQNQQQTIQELRDQLEKERSRINELMGLIQPGEDQIQTPNRDKYNSQ